MFLFLLETLDIIRLETLVGILEIGDNYFESLYAMKLLA
jgi:hypothetical protein